MPILRTGDVSDDDLRALASAGARLGASPFDLLQVFYAESGFTHDTLNTLGCVGVNQFCPGPDHQSGGTFGIAVPGLTVSQYQALPLSGQLRYVVPFLSQKPKSAMKSARDIYWVNWRPASYIPNAPDSHVIYAPASGDLGLDAALGNGKPFVTAGDLEVYLDKHTLPQARYQELASRLSKISPPLAPSLGPGAFIAAAAVIGVVLYTKG